MYTWNAVYTPSASKITVDEDAASKAQKREGGKGLQVPKLLLPLLLLTPMPMLLLEMIHLSSASESNAFHTLSATHYLLHSSPTLSATESTETPPTPLGRFPNMQNLCYGSGISNSHENNTLKADCVSTFNH